MEQLGHDGILGMDHVAAVWGLVIVLIIWAVQSATTAKAQSQADGGNALQTLDERLARGDIDPDEYKERRAILETRP